VQRDEGAVKRDAQALPGMETRHLMIHRRKTPADAADRFQNGIVIPVTQSAGPIDEYVGNGWTAFQGVWLLPGRQHYDCHILSIPDVSSWLRRTGDLQAGS
jgi:hypothetical protein